MPKVKYTAAQGLIQEAGSGVQLESFPTVPVIGKTATTAIAAPGVYTFTAGAVMTGSMPTAASFPGAVFVFRNGDTNGSVLTGSAEAAGVQVFKAPVTGSGTQAVGSKIQLAGTLGASVVLQSDGRNFCVIGQTGQITYSGT